jgi:Protein of unknown function (DUF3592)
MEHSRQVVKESLTTRAARCRVKKTMDAEHAGRWWLAAMGIVLIAAGSFFAWRLWLSYQKTSVSRSWPAIPCEIESSKIVSERPNPSSALAHRVEIRYRYEMNGVKHISTRIRHVESAPTAHLDKALEVQLRFPPGTRQHCHVNPANSAESVLLPGTRAALYSIWFPLLFVAGGVGMLMGLFRRKTTHAPA